MSISYTVKSRLSRPPRVVHYHYSVVNRTPTRRRIYAHGAAREIASKTDRILYHCTQIDVRLYGVRSIIVLGKNTRNALDCLVIVILRRTRLKR